MTSLCYSILKLTALEIHLYTPPIESEKLGTFSEGKAEGLKNKILRFASVAPHHFLSLPLWTVK